MAKLKPRGFVIATGLHPLVSTTASHVVACLRPSLDTQPTDVPYAITVDSGGIFKNNRLSCGPFGVN